MPDGSGYKKNLSNPSAPSSGSANQSGSGGSGGGSGESSPASEKAGSAGSGGGQSRKPQQPPKSPSGPVPTPYPNLAAATPSDTAAQKADAAGLKAEGAAASPEELQNSGPVGQGDYVVGAGDCMSSIAKEKGYFWETLWNHAANSELKTVRKNPNVLLTGDLVTLPAKNEKKESGETEMRHRFLRKGEPSQLKLQLLDDDRPLADKPYELHVDEQVFPGTTDGEGKISVAIPGSARRARLLVGAEPDLREFVLDLGKVEPIESIMGVQQRLHNLGYGAAPGDGAFGPETEAAVRAFQKHCKLAETGQPDEQTRQTLLQKHGC